ncbi:hypothetical protein HYALB_00008998 [Hymenoscyphus albidus]|uniref:Cytochrome P450 n=1 Tax=Hymenoscyphus albidus TaxID=595503 RepID=A0A9N9LR29_9HELO|nr:hypothetical protein HYALB_00008998 [Hymenoscyphus albidus]
MPSLWISTFPLYILPLYLLWRKLHLWLAMRQAGCSPPISYKHTDPFLGTDLLSKKSAASQNGDARAIDQSIFKTYGKTVRTTLLGKNYFLTMDSQNMQTILAPSVEKFGNEPMNREACRPFLGDGIITTDGALWKRSRQLIIPLFTRAQISELSTFSGHVERMLERVPCDGEVVDMQPLLKMLFLDSSTEFIFGRSANALKTDSQAEGSVAERLPVAFDDALSGMRKRFMLPRVVLWIMPRDRKWLEKCAEVHAIIDGFIEEEMELQKREKVASESSTPYRYVLLRELVKITDDKLFIRNELLNIFFPARDTAGVLTGNVIFLLARHPHVWKKLRTEVLEIGQKSLSFELLKSMKYLHAVINETLRILAPVDGSWKTCLAPCVLPQGGGPKGDKPILLQSGDQVELVFGAMHKDPMIWGEDAEDFVPERWEGRKQNWEYIPFMGGRRICPAQQNVLTDVAFVLVRLLQKFEGCENRDECVEHVDAQVFTKESRNGVKVAFTLA